ncbi:MAG: metallophosphoesterase [Nitrospirae bacterium]|nr:metallophosphoesterase [Nitrospirota bacterium]
MLRRTPFMLLDLFCTVLFISIPGLVISVALTVSSAFAGPITHALTGPSTTSVSQGGTYGPITSSITNGSSSSYPLTVYAAVYTPKGLWVDTACVPMTLSAGQAVNNNISRFIPAFADTGTYYFYENLYDTSGKIIDSTSVSFTVTSSGGTDSETFAIVVYPDSQNEVDNGADKVSVWQKQNQWVVNNITNLNIVAVFGVGDIVNDPSDTAYTTATVKGYDLIDNAGIPYLTVAGNHDYPNTNVADRDSSKYDQYFGPSRFSGKQWYLGGYPANSDANMAIAFDIGTRKFLVIGLEVFPRFEAVSWAQSVINANQDRDVIVVTHAYLKNDGTRYLVNDVGVDPSTTYSGQGLWDHFIKSNSRIFMVIGGHDICSPTEAYLISADNGNKLVSQIFTNHQCYPDNGSVLLLKFKTSSGIIEAIPYATNFEENDPEGIQYTFSY